MSTSIKWLSMREEEMIQSGSLEMMLESFREVAESLYPNDPLIVGDPFYRDTANSISGDHARLFVLPRRGRIAAFESDLYLGAKPIGIVGYYECEDNLETARIVMDAASEWLRSQGARVIVGPMDGSTWHKYRFKLDSASPSYFLDLHHKPWYPSQFMELGFTPLAKYYSTIVSIEGLIAHDQAAHPPSVEGILIVGDQAVREFRSSDAEGELALLYDLSMRGFRDNFLFTPISLDEFLGLYKPIVPLVDPRLVLFAHAKDSGQPIGFGFAIPDNVNPTRIVMKSAAVLPKYRGKGIGSLLTRTIHARANELGYNAAVHAFMHEDNISRRLGSAHAGLEARPLAEYALFSKQI